MKPTFSFLFDSQPSQSGLPKSLQETRLRLSLVAKAEKLSVKKQRKKKGGVQFKCMPYYRTIGTQHRQPFILIFKTRKKKLDA